MCNAAIQDRDHGKNLNSQPVIPFLKTKDLQNRYTKKQPTRFSIAPFNQKTKEKKFPSIQRVINFVRLKK